MVIHEPMEADWNGKKITLKPGSMIASLDDIREMAGIEISIQNIRTALDNFENKYEFLTQQTTTYGRLITILNWREYQKDGLTQQQSDEQKENAEKLYNYYIEKVQPKIISNSKRLAINNILRHSKKHSFKDLATAVKNYISTALKYDPQYRKKPSNFFGVNEPFFKDYLPGGYKAVKKDTRVNAPKTLTAERLAELNA